MLCFYHRCRCSTSSFSCGGRLLVFLFDDLLGLLFLFLYSLLLGKFFWWRRSALWSIAELFEAIKSVSQYFNVELLKWLTDIALFVLLAPLSLVLSDAGSMLLFE